MDQVQTLIQETKDTLAEYLPKLVAACEQVAHELQSSQDSWVGTFHQVVEGLFWVQDAIRGIQAVDEKQLESLRVSELAEQCALVQTALENRDFVLFADLLQYELKPSLEMYLQAVCGF